MERHGDAEARISERIEVASTPWGVILREDTPEAHQAKLMRSFGGYAAMAFAFMSAMLWVLPGSLLSPDIAGFRLGLMGAFLGLAFVLLRASATPKTAEVQFDFTSHEIRFGVSQGSTSEVDAGFAMAHVSGLTVEPIVQDSEYAEMRLFFEGIDQGMLVVSGLRSELEPVATRLRRDIRRAAARSFRIPSRAA